VKRIPRKIKEFAIFISYSLAYVLNGSSSNFDDVIDATKDLFSLEA